MRKTVKKYIKLLLIAFCLLCLAFFGYVACLIHQSASPQNNITPSDNAEQSSQGDISSQSNAELNVQHSNELKHYGKSKEILPLTLSQSDENAFVEILCIAESPFAMETYYGLEDALSLYHHSIINKQNSATLVNESGLLDSDKLTRRVLQNNEALLAQGKNNINTFYTTLDTSEIQSICQLIAQVVNDRLYDISIIDAADTLEQLTIFQRTGSASNAYITNNLTFVFNPTMTEMYGNVGEISGSMENAEDAKLSVLVHEIMHLLQYAASDNLDTNGIEAGICRMYNIPNQEPLVSVDSLWNTWLLDASAELGMADYLQVSPGTYPKKISYLRSYNLSRFHELDLEADGLEQVAFAPSLEHAYSRLKLNAQREQQQFLAFLYSVEITQTDPDEFWSSYTGEANANANDGLRMDVRMKIRTQVIEYLTKNFYRNLCSAITEGTVSDTDTLFYLLRTWELDVYHHLNYTETENLEHCQDFILWHAEIQDNLFQLLSASSNCDTSTLKTLYQHYALQQKTNDDVDSTTINNCNLDQYSPYTADYLQTIKQNYTSTAFVSNHVMATYLKKRDGN